MYLYPFKLLLKLVQGAREMAPQLRQLLVLAGDLGGSGIHMGAKNRLFTPVQEI